MAEHRGPDDAHTFAIAPRGAMTGRTGVRRVILLTLGWEDLPKTVSVWGDTSGERLKEPVPAVLC